MSDNDTQPHSNGKRTPPADMLAKAADILGVDESAEAPRAETGPELMVTVAGPTSSRVMRLRSDVPVGQLAATLGEAIGVRVVSRVSTRSGEPIMPDRTLADLGLRAGSVIMVDAPGAPAVPPASGAGVPAAPGLANARPVRRSGAGAGVLAERTPAQWAVLGGGLVVVVVLAMLLGGAVFGGGGSSSSAPAGQALADQAATAWVNGTVFHGARLSTVPADLGRSGPPTKGQIENAGSSTSGSITSHLYVVDPPAGGPYGLSVVTYKDQIAYALTVTGLPFATSVPAGRTPFVAQTGTIVPPNANKQAQSWAQSTFGTLTDPADPEGYGLDGTATPVNEWRPTTRGAPALVVRVQVPLAEATPNSPEAKKLTVDQAAVKHDMSQLAMDKTAIATDGTAVSQATAANAQADQAAQAAVNAANSANPPNPPPLAAAATAAQQAAAAAQSHLTSEQTAQNSANSALGTDQQKLSQDQAALASATAAAAKVTSVYDVAFNAAGAPIAWAPADYLIGTNGQEVS